MADTSSYSEPETSSILVCYFSRWGGFLKATEHPANSSEAISMPDKIKNMIKGRSMDLNC